METYQCQLFPGGAPGGSSGHGEAAATGSRARSRRSRGAFPRPSRPAQGPG